MQSKTEPDMSVISRLLNAQVPDPLAESDTPTKGADAPGMHIASYPEDWHDWITSIVWTSASAGQRLGKWLLSQTGRDLIITAEVICKLLKVLGLLWR
ncbi:MAG: hypothetical protein SFY96_12585 [Planctomycetota bacterium]|nr:hypothetical protein [Planctomycetota bacterium]